MQNSVEIANAVTSLISLAILWSILYWLYRDYRLDLYRERLFLLRDKLFDLAIKDEIAFEATSYGLLRSTINGAIRNGHRCGLLDAIMFIAFIRDENFRAASQDFGRRWKESLLHLPKDSQKEVSSLRKELHFVIVDQMIFTSSFLILTLLAFLIGIVLHHISTSIIKKIIGAKLIDTLANNMDYASNSLVLE